MVKNELRDYKGNNCIKLFGKLYYDDIAVKSNFPESYISECNAKVFATDGFFSNELNVNHPFVAEIDTRAISCWGNVGLSVMQFALWMNPKKIYLVGLDHSGKHFGSSGLINNDTVGLEKYAAKWWEENNKTLRKAWKQLRTFAKIYYPEIEIISINPIGLKGIFSDWFQQIGEFVKREEVELPSMIDSYIVKDSNICNLPDFALSSEHCDFHIDSNEIKENHRYLCGWACNSNDDLEIYAECNGRIYKSTVLPRPDIQESFNLNSIDKGFSFWLPECRHVKLFFVNIDKKIIYQEEI